MGLVSGLLVECRFQAKHRGQHRNEDSTLSWGGHLTDDEVARAEQLRARARG